MELFKDCSFGTVVPELERYGFATVPNLLAPRAIDRLLRESAGLGWHRAEPTFGTRRVVQDYFFVKKFPASSLYPAVGRELEDLLNDAFFKITPHPIAEPLHFNEFRLQRYPPGSKGIEPHRDGPQTRYLVALIVLRHGGQLCFCEDGSRSGSISVESEPGDLILMRGVGFLGSGFQPWHYVNSSKKVERLTLGMRQVVWN